MSWHYLQGLEEVSSEAICWDGERFAQSSGQTTLAGYCLPDSETGCCLDSRFGMMSKHSMETHGEDESMSSLAGSPARTSAQPAKALESMGQGRECGSTWPGSFARYDRDSSLWRTPQCSLLEGLDVFSETWPRWGTMQNGECWERMTAAPPMSATESGFWPTPTRHDGKDNASPAAILRKSPGLGVVAQIWPTPRAGNPGSRPNGKGGKVLAEEVKKQENGLMPGGQLNPPWVEWLMGWPIGWTDCEPLGMDKFQRWQQQHSAFYRIG
jgi:hypothetical protein